MAFDFFFSLAPVLFSTSLFSFSLCKNEQDCVDSKAQGIEKYQSLKLSTTLCCLYFSCVLVFRNHVARKAFLSYKYSVFLSTRFPSLNLQCIRLWICVCLLFFCGGQNDATAKCQV